MIVHILILFASGMIANYAEPRTTWSMGEDGEKLSPEMVDVWNDKRIGVSIGKFNFDF